MVGLCINLNGIEMQSSNLIRLINLEVGEYSNNCYVLIDPSTNISAIIDAAYDPEAIIEALEGTNLALIVTTHRHQDHWGALEAIKNQFPDALVAVHSKDAAALPLTPDIFLEHGDTLQVGSVPLRVISTPGHTEGSICLISGSFLFTGDTLFPGGPGHSDSPESLRTEINSIVTHLYKLDPETNVLPGHGDATTIAESKLEYEKFASEPHEPDLHGDVVWSKS